MAGVHFGRSSPDANRGVLGGLMGLLGGRREFEKQDGYFCCSIAAISSRIYLFGGVEVSGQMSGRRYLYLRSGWPSLSKSVPRVSLIVCMPTQELRRSARKIGRSRSLNPTSHELKHRDVAVQVSQSAEANRQVPQREFGVSVLPRPLLRLP